MIFCVSVSQSGINCCIVNSLILCYIDKRCKIQKLICNNDQTHASFVIHHQPSFTPSFWPSWIITKSCLKLPLFKTTLTAGWRLNYRYITQTSKTHLPRLLYVLRLLISLKYTELYCTLWDNSRLYRTIMDYAGLYWTILNYTRVYGILQDNTKRYWIILTILVYTGQCSTVPDYTELYWTMMDYTWLYWTKLDYTGIFWYYLVKYLRTLA